MPTVRSKWGAVQTGSMAEVHSAATGKTALGQIVKRQQSAKNAHGQDYVRIPPVAVSYNTDANVTGIPDFAERVAASAMASAATPSSRVTGSAEPLLIA